MRKFLLNFGVFLFPFFLVAISFWVLDPFKIIYDHGEKLFQETGTLNGFTLNRDFVGTELFLKRRDSLKYDSFVFGSSRSTVYLSHDWAQYIDHEVVPFHFIGSGESLFGIWKKFLLLNKLDHKIDNALLIIDYELLSKTKNGSGVIGIRHPATAGQKFYFYLTHFVEYITTDFFIQFLDYNFFGKKKPYMDKLFDNDSRGLVFDNYKNDWIHQGKENALKQDSIGYYKKRNFGEQPANLTTAPKSIHSVQKKMLGEISTILKKNDTNFRIVINPLYDQKAIHPSDLSYLRTTFGEDNVFNFSGKNEYTESTGNYYDRSHYKPFIARSILKRIYKN